MTPSNPIAPQLEGLVTRQEVLDAHGWKTSTLTTWTRAGIIGPAIKLGGKTFWKMPTTEEAAAIVSEMKRRKIEGAIHGGNTRQRNINRKSDSPEGLLSTPQMVESGIPKATLRTWRRYGLISPAWTCPNFQTQFWRPLTQEQIKEIRALMRQRQVDGAVKARKINPPKQKEAKPPKPKKADVELPGFIPAPTPPAPKTKASRIGIGLPYDEALAKGKGNPKWANILGFNLWRDGNTYKAESIGQAPSFPWEHCERHFLKGDTWASRIVRPTGEVIT
jgi:hypothetical protein